MIWTWKKLIDFVVKVVLMRVVWLLSAESVKTVTCTIDSQYVLHTHDKFWPNLFFVKLIKTEEHQFKWLGCWTKFRNLV